MPYQLILSEQIDDKAKDVGENVFLSNLPDDYKVFLFYYPGALGNDDLEARLRKLGADTGKNLFVNIGKLNDPGYAKISLHFQIKRLPAIVITATSDLASETSLRFSAFVRIDNKHVLESPDKTLPVVQNLFNLFVGGKVAEALAESKKINRENLLERISQVLTGALKGVLKFIDERDISVSIVEGKFELKRK